MNINAKILVSNESPFHALWYERNEIFKILTWKKLSGDKLEWFGKVSIVCMSEINSICLLYIIKFCSTHIKI